MKEALALIDFINGNPTPFQVVATASEMLSRKGFKPLAGDKKWGIETGHGYFYAKEGSFIAFFLGKNWHKRGLRFIGAHTDSPNLKVRLHPPTTKSRYQQLGIEVYGGVLLNSWLDRDLSLAGRVFLKSGGCSLVHFPDPLLRIPQLAIHLDRDINSKGLLLNPQTHMNPILGISGEKGGNPLIELLARQLKVNSEEIATYELSLCPTQPGTLAGINRDFIFSTKMDNQAMCHASLTALTKLEKNHEGGAVVALFDHEEVGSISGGGADGPILIETLDRLMAALGAGREELYRVLASSYFLSSDMAQGMHPNYPEKFDPQDFPIINQGPALKFNCNQRYATEGRGLAFIQGIAHDLKIPLQNFTNRNDLGCGSTIGPIVAGKLGIPTIDIGNPMLSMHSIREMAGSEDHGSMIRLMGGFLQG